MPYQENKIGDLLYMTASNITAPHAFTTRLGGVSGGIYASLNLGLNVGDDPSNVRQNYKILGNALGFNSDSLVFSRQVHKTDVRIVSKLDRRALFEPVPYEADGLLTAEEDVPLIVFTADCVPILLYDPVGRAVGAVHAGWRGTVADIAGIAVRKMARHFGCRPENIRAAIGPCISQCCFETGDDVAAAVRLLLGSRAPQFIAQQGEKSMVDLKGINAFLLKNAGVKNIEISHECTSCLNNKYWSHRVTNGRRGSQASVIMMKGRAN